MKRFLAMLSVVAMLIIIAPEVYAEERTVDTAGLRAYILTEAKTGAVLEEYNADEQLNVGYLSKLMALLLIAEDIETGKYTFSTELTAPQSVYGTKGAVIWLEPGDKLSVDELLKGVIIGNANDAMTALAEASERSIEDFVMRMNSEAFDLGLRNTAFYSPYGYYDEREHTTARELAVICGRLAGYDSFRRYFTTWRDFIKEGQTELVSENTLTRTYDRHIGFKACHSEQSGYCAAECGMNDGGTRYIAVVLGADSEDISLGAAKKLVNHGFSAFKVTAVMFPEEMMKPVSVRNGEESAVGVELASHGSVVLPKGAGELSTVVVLPEYLSAPIKKGQRVGTAAFYNGKTLVCETDIVASDRVERLTFLYTLRKLLVNMLK